MTSLAYYPKPYFKYKTSSSDWTVITGSPHTTHNGIPVARKGDQVMCKKCKKMTTIVSGDASFIVDGAPIARGGDVTSCGAKLIANQQAFAESDFDVGSIAQAEAIKKETLEQASKYDTAFHFVDNEDVPYVGFHYTAENKQSGQIYKGITDESGWTERFYSDTDDQIEVKLDLEWQKDLGAFE